MKLLDDSQLAKPGYISVLEGAERREVATSKDLYEPPRKKMRGDDSSVDKSQLAKPGSKSILEVLKSPSKNPYEGVSCHSFRCLCCTKKELEEEEGRRSQGTKSILDDDGLRHMFIDWARKEGKTYRRFKEEKLRFLIWCANKKLVDRNCSKTGRTFSIDLIGYFSDWTIEETDQQLFGLVPSEGPSVDGIPLRFETLLDNMDQSARDESWDEFKQWALEHGRNNYGDCTKEHKKRFLAFLDNRKRVLELEEDFLGFCYSNGLGVRILGCDSRWTVRTVTAEAVAAAGG